MGLLEEADAAGDGKRNVAPGQFQLQFERVEVRAVKRGHIVQIAALITQFQQALGDERGLLRGIAAHDEHGLGAGLPRRRELLGELLQVGGDGGVGRVEDLRRAAVVRFNLVSLGRWITLLEFEDVREVRPAPGVDALRVVAHDHDVVVARREQVNQVALEFVRVLILIDHEIFESLPVSFEDIRVFPEKL